MANKRKRKVKINTNKESKAVKSLRRKIESELIGQNRAVKKLLRAVSSYQIALNDPMRPIGGFIFVGPTGVGKTFAAKVFARHFLEGKNKNRDYLTRIDGSTLSREHTISKLIGSPPGYVGYGETNLLSQENIDSYHFDARLGDDDGVYAKKLKAIDRTLKRQPLTKRGQEQQSHLLGIKFIYEEGKPYRSVVLFDEIEKSHPDIWNTLLQIMEEGKIQMGKGEEETNFRNSVIILTTNIGQRSIQGIISGRGQIGFKKFENMKKLDQDIYRATREQVKKKFPPELFKRLELVVFRPLIEKDFSKILDNLLAEKEERINRLIKTMSAGNSIKIDYSDTSKKFLLEKGADPYYGVRTLRSVVEKHIQAPIANALCNKEIIPGDKVSVNRKGEQLIFFKEPSKSKPKEKRIEEIDINKEENFN